MAFGNLPKKPNIVPIVTDQGRGVMHRRRAGRHQPAARAQQSRDLGRCVTLAARRRWNRGRGDHRRDHSLPDERLTANALKLRRAATRTPHEAGALTNQPTGAARGLRSGGERDMPWLVLTPGRCVA